MAPQPRQGPGRRRRVLVLGGWSPGPLGILQHRMQADTDFEEPSIPMPPSGVRWCLNPFWALLLAYLAVACWLLGAVDGWLDGIAANVVRVCIVVASLVIGRLLVAGLVWFAIRDAVRVAEARILELRPDVVVGFSWGGGVLCWLLAERRWTGPAVLLAPTLHKVRGAACLSGPKLASPRDGAPVHVFHAKGDPFCPDEQVDEFRAADWEVHLHGDNHVLCSRRTVDEIASTLQRLLDAAGSAGSSGSSEGQPGEAESRPCIR